MDVNVIYRALDPFNTEEGRERFVHMSSTKFHTVTKQFPLSFPCSSGEGKI